MAAANFTAALAFVLEHEGGFANHPRDPGGATMRGITLATFRQWHRDPTLTVDNLRNISDADVSAIYEALFWNAVQGDELPAGIDHMVFDMAVNAGVRRSSMQLQTAAKMTGRDIDGVVGPRTLAAVRSHRPVNVVELLRTAHERHYRGLGTFATFGRGWLRRLDKRYRLAVQLLA